MFFTEDFKEKYLKRAKEIMIDGKSIYEMPSDCSIALAAFLYDMYMLSRKYTPDDEIWIDEKFDRYCFIISGDST